MEGFRVEGNFGVLHFRVEAHKFSGLSRLTTLPSLFVKGTCSTFKEARNRTGASMWKIAMTRRDAQACIFNNGVRVAVDACHVVACSE